MPARSALSGLMLLWRRATAWHIAATAALRCHSCSSGCSSPLSDSTFFSCAIAKLMAALRTRLNPMRATAVRRSVCSLPLAFSARELEMRNSCAASAGSELMTRTTCSVGTISSESTWRTRRAMSGKLGSSTLPLLSSAARSRTKTKAGSFSGFDEGAGLAAMGTSCRDVAGDEGLRWGLRRRLRSAVDAADEFRLVGRKAAGGDQLIHARAGAREADGDRVTGDGTVACGFLAAHALEGLGDVIDGIAGGDETRIEAVEALDHLRVVRARELGLADGRAAPGREGDRRQHEGEHQEHRPPEGKVFIERQLLQRDQHALGSCAVHHTERARHAPRTCRDAVAGGPLLELSCMICATGDRIRRHRRRRRCVGPPCRGRLRPH